MIYCDIFLHFYFNIVFLFFLGYLFTIEATKFCLVVHNKDMLSLSCRNAINNYLNDQLLQLFLFHKWLQWIPSYQICLQIYSLH